MQIPPEISFRGVPATDRLKGRIQDEVDKLERYFDGIIRCRVAVELPHRRHEDGNLYHVGIRVTVPGREVYFHRNAVADGDFEELELGMDVRLAEEQGVEGPQATVVHVLGKRDLPPVDTVR